MMKTLLTLTTILLPMWAGTPEQIAFFEKRVRPVLVNNCYGCHSAETKPAGDLRVDDRNGLLRGGLSGAAVVPGDASKSLLLARVRHSDPKKRMPKEGDILTPAQIADLEAWIRDGVAWPEDKPAVTSRTPAQSYQRLRERHWSLQPIANPQLPAADRWATTDIDRFIAAGLRAKGLKPVGDADRTTLIRRLSFDLTGLPPTPGQITAFVNDRSPQAYETLVDRLLASPRFGERWGRHWLDVARYGESSGPSRNIPYPHAWRYRDYVIDAINRDIPYNRFLQEQIAGDLLAADTPTERDRLATATGFLALGPKDVNQRFKERFQMDNVAEQIDTVTRSSLALTVTCARCHDHKFDPIPTADYYALAGIFTSTVDAAGMNSRMGGAGLDYYNPKLLVTLSVVPPTTPVEKERLSRIEGELAVAKREWEAIRGTPEGLKIAANGRPTQYPYRVRYEKLQAEYLALTDPAARGYAVHGAREATQIADTAIRIRGEAERHGDIVPRGFLSAVSVPGAAPVNPKQSGRLELARWLTSEKNPLTARVYVNRVWHYLFGLGIVTTVDNFGVTGDRPSHPELLDHLAAQFIREGWSTKKLIRSIVLSRAYRLSSDAPASYREIDPANRLVWRHAPRRLEAEEIRDAVLLSAGRLDFNTHKGSPAQELPMVEIRDDGPQARRMKELADQAVVRSVYLPLLRGLTPRALEAFDPVTQTLVTGQRDATTVPTQALFLLNSGFIRKQSLLLADALLAANASETQQIRQAYRLVLGRDPEGKEIDRSASYLASYAQQYASLPAPVTPAPVQVAAKPAPTTNGADLLVGQEEERIPEVVVEEAITFQSPKQAALQSLVQALYASAEFRFVR